MTPVFLTGALLLLLFSLAPLSPRSWFLADMFSHFVLQWAVAALVLMLLAVAFRIHGRWIYISLLASYLLCIFHMLPCLLAAPPKEAAEARLKILHANVWVKNRETAALKRLIAAEKPDVIAVSETNAAFAALFAELKGDYPHQHVMARDDTSFGIALLSKLPLEGLETKYLAAPGIPSLFARVRAGGKTVTVAVLHAANPLNAFRARDAELEMLARWHDKARPENLILAGDFNATPYCPALKRMARQMKLTEARAGRGPLGTFPAWAPLPLLRLPIDHVLTGGGAHAEDFRTGPDIGSDHLPVMATIKLSS